MSAQFHTPRSHAYSLTDWLVLAGVSVEIADQPAVYTISMPEMLQAAEPVQEIVKPAKTQNSVQPVLQIEKFNTLEELNNFCTSWKGIGLAKTASRAVPGSGKASQPRLMVICDIPDDSEDRQGQAFSSPTSQLIRQALVFAGLAEEDTYFTYLSKWRTPAKRSLTTVERDLCAQILSQEIALVQPTVILTLGESTVKALIPDFGNNLSKNSLKNTYINQYTNRKSTLMASQKGEFLVKNPLMKKNFWFGLLELAATIRTAGDA